MTQPAERLSAPGRSPEVARAAPSRARTEEPIAGGPTARLGFWSAVLAVGASVVFLVASVPVLLGAVAPPWDNVLTLAPSLVLAPAFLVLLVCVSDAAPRGRKVWSQVAVAFAGVYTALVSIVYVVELAVVEPLIVRGEGARVGLLSIEPGGVLNAIDGLGYAFLGLGLLFAAPIFVGRRLDRLIRWLLIANGVAVVPILLTYFVDRAFLVVAGPLWGFAVPAAAVALAVSFRRAERSSDRAATPQSSRTDPSSASRNG